MKNLTEEQQVKLIVLVNRYMTPFAILLVGVGLVLSQPVPWIAWSCASLVVFSVVFNLGTVRLVQSRGAVPSWMAPVRLWTNLTVNVVFVYLLGGYWTPIWLLFVLTPAATALYADRKRTLATALGVSALMILAFAARRLNAPVDWGKTFVEAAFIVFLALFLNEVATSVRRVENAR